MAEIYGNRWKNCGTLPGARGGQADVYFVEDLHVEYLEKSVLKRIRNPRRIERFRAEVLAGTRLKHPNIMRIIDHSDLEQADDKKPMYIVMPFAKCGSLTQRVKLYENSIDSTIQVAKALASGLSYAHTFEPSVIHRDFKPDNILFTAEDNNPLIADFGICLLSDQPRVTESAEIVGSWAFLAPELQKGGQLEVSPAADLYSLGKVIYFMISGGKILPRELHREPDFDLSSKSQRHRLLWILFDKLICSLSERIPAAAEVVRRLEAIEEWGKRSVSLPSAVKHAVAEITTADATAKKVKHVDRETRERTEREFEGFSKSLADWVNSRFQELAIGLTVDETLQASVSISDETDSSKICLGPLVLMPQWAIELNVTRIIKGLQHTLILLFARPWNLQNLTGGKSSEKKAPIEGYLLPLHVRGGSAYPPSTGRVVYLLESVRKVSGRQMISSPSDLKLLLRIDGSHWPMDVRKCEQLIEKSLQVFLQVVKIGSRPPTISFKLS